MTAENAKTALARPGTKPREKPQKIADELRRLIILGELDEGDSLGHEPELIERFGVSRPSLREALRILEAEGLITVVRGVQGGVVVHRPDKRLTARTAAIVLQSRNVSLADVFDARTIVEPAAVRLVASARNRKASAPSAEGADRRGGIGDRRPGGVRPGQCPVPRGAGRHGGEPDAGDRGRNAQRGGGTRRHHRQPVGLERRVGRHPAPGNALPGATGRVDRGRRRRRRRGALAHAHGCGGSGHARASGPRPSSTSWTISNRGTGRSAEQVAERPPSGAQRRRPTGSGGWSGAPCGRRPSGQSIAA